MYKIIITIDYEIHGNGDGNPYELMVEPTNRMIELFNKYGAKLSIMADVAEIMKFKEYYDTNGRDSYHYVLIERQLQQAIMMGHDVQLHIHSGYVDAKIDKKKLYVNWDDYNLCLLPRDRIETIIRNCKDFLIRMLKAVKEDYECIAFRAANWSMMPTKAIYDGLVNNQIRIDTSVFKYGKRSNKVCFDYSEAYDPLIPWMASKSNICERDDNGSLMEIPIYCEQRHFIHFITPIRLFRVIRARFHKHEKIDLYSKYGHSRSDSMVENTSKPRKRKLSKLLSLFNRQMAWKMDINQATGSQLIGAIKRIQAKYGKVDGDIPIVLIGHSKSFLRFNERTLEPFLKYVTEHSDKFEFATFGDIDTDKYYGGR